VEGWGGGHCGNPVVRLLVGDFAEGGREGNEADLLHCLQHLIILCCIVLLCWGADS